jgi:hypothetical protein
MERDVAGYRLTGSEERYRSQWLDTVSREGRCGSLCPRHLPSCYDSSHAIKSDCYCCNRSRGHFA